MRIPAVTFLIPMLEILRRPSAVCRLLPALALFTLAASVTALCVDAVYRVFIAGRCSHIVKEVLEGRSPALTYIRPERSVVFPVDPVWIVTALEHSRPYFEFSRPGKAALYQCNTATTADFSAREMVGSDNLFIATVATTKPVHQTFAFWCALNCNQKAETLSGEIGTTEATTAVSRRAAAQMGSPYRPKFSAIAAAYPVGGKSLASWLMLVIYIASNNRPGSEALSREVGDKTRMLISHDVSFREKDASWSGPAIACNNRAARFFDYTHPLALCCHTWKTNHSPANRAGHSALIRSEISTEKGTKRCFKID